MPDSFTVLWTLERCRWLRRIGDHGPLEVIFGGPHTSQPSIIAVCIGDIIYPVVVQKGGLYVIAALTVENLVPPEDYIRDRLGHVVPPHKMWDEPIHARRNTRDSYGHRLPATCADLAATGLHGTTIRFDRQIPAAALESIRLGPHPGREQPLKGVSEGRMKNNFSLQGHVRRLSYESAEIFAACF